MLGSGGGVFSELNLVVLLLSFDFGSKLRSEDVEILAKKRPLSGTAAVSVFDLIVSFFLGI